MNHKRSWASPFGLCLLLLATTPAMAADFITIGTHDLITPEDISGNGQQVVGYYGSVADRTYFVWTPVGGLVDMTTIIPELASFNSAGLLRISDDGNTIAGVASPFPALYGRPGFDDLEFGVFRWTSEAGFTRVVPAEDPGFVGTYSASVNALSGDGTTIAGRLGLEPARETSNGLELIAFPGGYDASTTRGVSRDGGVIVGTGFIPGSGSIGDRGWIWTEAAGAQVLTGEGLPAPGNNSPFAVSGDGKVVVGSADFGPQSEPFRWTDASGFLPLRHNDGRVVRGSAIAVSEDGNTIIGNGRFTQSGVRPTTDSTAFVWDPVNGARDVRSVVNGLGLDVDGWDLTQAWAVSAEGAHIVGRGTDPNGDDAAWLADLTPKELVVVLDWESPAQRRVAFFFNELTGQSERIMQLAESPVVSFDPAMDAGNRGLFKEFVRKEVQDIFDRSGVRAKIVTRDASDPEALTSEDALTVFFSPEIIHDHDGDPTTPDQPSTIAGVAYDVGPRPGTIDRFNRRQGGEVLAYATQALLALEDGDPTAIDEVELELLAETIAHEAGHGFGLRHVDPGGNANDTVMDYDIVPFNPEAFSGLVSNILEPPNSNNGADGRFGSHNPVYHLRRYGMSETNEELTQAGLERGTWDEGTYDLLNVTIESLELHTLPNETLHNPSALSEFGSGALGPDGEPAGGTLFSLSSIVAGDTGDLFEFDTTSDAPFRLLAGSEPGSTLDVYFGNGSASDPDLLFDELSPGTFAGSVYWFDSALGGLQEVGNFTGSISRIATVGPLPAAASAIPLPPSWALMAGALLLAYPKPRRPKKSGAIYAD